MSSKVDPIRIAVLGEPAVGKTALVVKVLSGRYIWNYDPTLEDIYKHSLVDNDQEDGEVHSLEIMDTAGYTAMEVDNVQRDGYIKWADAFILQYSVTDLQSFHAVDSLRLTIMDLKKLGTHIAIVGNKADLAHLRQVERKIGQQLAAAVGCRFYELSVREDQEPVREPFIDLCREVKARLSREGVKLRRRSSASQMLRKLIQKKLSI